MTRRTAAAAPLILLAASGCLASKGDIRLLQEEFRATRSQISVVDTSVARANEQRRQQIATLSATVDRLLASQLRTADSLRFLAQRFASFQASASSDLQGLSQEMVRVGERLGQNIRNVQELRAAQEQLTGQTPSGGAQPAATPASSSAPPGTPGAATLFTTGRDALASGAYTTARRSFEDLLTAWPNADEAPRALLYVGESYSKEGNTAAADSVFQLVVTRYPKSSDAASDALYKHARILWDAKKTAEARAAFDRVIKDYPASSAAGLARDFLRTNR
ncbi:MAG TPA: tetratricopeptide repeat protein [Gemmatimonadaceae bacterium]